MEEEEKNRQRQIRRKMRKKMNRRRSKRRKRGRGGYLSPPAVHNPDTERRTVHLLLR